MAGEEDAMNVIDKLNQEFDVIMDKNIQLEKDKLELYKEIHKLKFKMMIEDDEVMSSTWCGEMLWLGGVTTGDTDNIRDGFEGISRVVDWSDELFDAMRGICPLEKNVILKELYGEDNWNEMLNAICGENDILPEENDPPPYPVVLYGGYGWATATWSADEWNKKLIDTFPGGVFE